VNLFSPWGYVSPFLNNWLRNFVDRISKRLHDHSFTKHPFWFIFDLHQMHLKSCVKLNADVCLLAHLIILFFHLPYFFSTTLHTRLGFSHHLVLGVSHYICNQPLDFMGIYLFCWTHGGERMILHDVMWNAFVVIATNVGLHMLQDQTHVLPSPSPRPIVFMSLNQHFVINWWCLHVGRCCHCQPNLSWFGFAGCFFSWGCYNSHNLSERW